MDKTGDFTKGSLDSRWVHGPDLIRKISQDKSRYNHDVLHGQTGAEIISNTDDITLITMITRWELGLEKQRNETNDERC